MSYSQFTGDEIKPKSKIKYWLPLFLIPIIFWGFYWYVGFDFRIIKLILFVTALFLLIYYSKDLTRSKKGFFGHDVSLFVLSFLLSICICFIYWGQNPILTFRAGIATLTVLFYFTLRRRGLDLKDIEILCIVFAIIYLILWLYALSKAPVAIFGRDDELDDSRGFFRISRLGGIDMVALLYCIALTKISDASKKWVWLLIAVGTFLLVFLSLRRILIGGLVVVTLIYLLRKKSVAIIIAGFLAFGGTEYLMRNQVFGALAELTFTQITEDSDSDMRHPEYEGAFRLFPFHVGTVVFGNGAPHVDSSYGQYEENLKAQYRFNRSDAGFVGLYTTFGFFMIFLMIRLFIRVVKQKSPPECLPYKLFIILLFISNLTMYVFWSYGIAFMICLYVLDRYRGHDSTIK